MKRVYTFPGDFQPQAESMYRCLRSVNLHPSWKFKGGMTYICLPDNEVECLRMMQTANPARWGNNPNEVDTR